MCVGLIVGEDSNDHHPIYMGDDDKLALQMPIVTKDLARCVPLNCGIPLDVPVRNQH